MDQERQDHAGLRDYVRLAWRRKWIIAVPIVLVPIAALVLALRQPELYRSSAQVLLSSQNLATQVSGTSSQGGLGSGSADRITRTQADLARVPQVVDATIKASGIEGLTPGGLLASSSVSTAENSDLLTFKVTNRDPAVAARLATEYAHQYTLYRTQLDTGSIKRARSAVQRRLAVLEAEGDRRTALYQQLVEKDQQLETLEALQTSNAFVVRQASNGDKVQPRPTRSLMLGIGLGIFLGLGLAFLWDALDTRVRSAEEVRERLGLPLLGRIPEPGRRLRSTDGLVMLDDHTSMGAESFRVLRTNLEFANLDRGARSVMITSAVQGEGKSTTAANLALALARAGRHVVLVDLDLRRPYLDKFFGLEDTPGVTHVALGHAPLEDAIVPVFSGEAPARGASGPSRGLVEVLPAGLLPPDPGEFVLSRAVGEILEQLAGRGDLLLVDTPPLLGLGDAFTMSEKVDAVILVTRLRTLRRPMLNELKRILDSVPAAKLGFVVTAADVDEGDYSGRAYGYRYGGKSRPGLEDIPTVGPEQPGRASA